ncbi:pyridoxamine 5'-phosphate oxidase family protein [Lactiplantibacillus modestisalitolerans]|uniref:Pyridoxamine 5'-phosphate oxidase family protein n=1 Tax=Lactiplantibacillus modestisalitolerans TaxID=1457219 RepID=A0ABV5WT72_9LACO|nr:pyridoxamine 5'-phosphate oxidase family protein [Lactiplantibacillus modestisalitolerans]
MQHTTRQAALNMLQRATAFTVATVDASGYPTLVVLSPLPGNRSLNHLFFYTSRQTQTVKNLAHTHRASLLYYQVADYSSLLLRGQLTLVGNDAFDHDWHDALNTFQQQLNYHDPVILRFQTHSLKIRHRVNTDHLELWSPEDS